jgi:hypothetical protein
VQLITGDFVAFVDDPRPVWPRIADFFGAVGADGSWIDDAAKIPARRPSKVAALAPDLAERLKDLLREDAAG